ncbi:unannotated protein [freshwater metagenome]|uniref:Unannotated protein n=1 Tax=freshwater metagenome TaxID=449393 RepID=A0A6J7SPR6_9ZZZZ
MAVASDATSTASVIIPESVFTATYPANSLPNACDATNKAVGDFRAISCATASALALTPWLWKSAFSTTTIDEIGPLVSVAARVAP